MKKITLAGLIFAFSLLGINTMAHAIIAPAPCSTAGTPFVTLTQHITNDPDSGTSGNWATDAFTEHVAVWLGSDNATYCATASTTDGTFVTSGGISPEKGTYLAPGITGTFTGGESYIIPSTAALSDLYSTSTPTSTVLPDSNTAGFSWWVNNVFPSISTSSGSSLTNAYSLTYVTDHYGTWTDANTGDVGDLGPAVNMTTHTGYGTIQAAVNAASAGDTIAVASGTYNETVSITKPLTLEGAQAGVQGANASSTPRNGDESTVMAMNISSGNVTVNGFSFANPGNQMNIGSSTILSGVVIENNIFSGYSSVGMPTNLAGNLVIKGNLFENPKASSEPMQIKSDETAGGCSGTAVENNTFINAANNGGADINFSCTGSASSNVTVSGNTDTGNTGETSFVALAGIEGGLTISDNTATGISGSALFFWGGMNGSASITGNAITNGGGSVVSIHHDLDGVNMGTFTIASNTFSGNVRGIYIASGAVASGAQIIAQGNNLSGNSTAGIDNEATVSTSTAVIATGNWWGSMSGPLDAVSGDGSIPDTNASGTGSAAVGAVKYSGWCVNSACATPTLTITAPAANGNYATGTYDFTASYMNGVTTNLAWAIRADTGCSTGTVAGNVDGFNNSSTFSGSAFSASLDTTKWANGEYCFVVNDMNGLRITRLFNVSNGGPSVPTLKSPVNGDIEATNKFYFAWNPSVESPSSTITYEFHSSMNPTETNGVLTTGLWDSGTLTTTTIYSSGAPDGTWYWQVRAKDAAGNTSAWSNIWSMTINTAPIPSLATCSVGTTPIFVETTIVNSASSTPTVGANDLVAGQTYLLVASGTWKNASLNVDDPAYASVDNWATYMHGYNIAPYYEGTNDLTLQVDNAFVNWGAYQPTHEYSYLYTGTGNPVSFRVFDGDANASSATPNPSWYGDNAGNLQVSVYACHAPTYVTTDAATGVTASDATLNGTNGDYSADYHSFWVSTSTFSTSTPTIPAGVYSTPGFGSIASGTPFSASLLSLTTNAVVHGQGTGTMPAIRPDTTYYYVAWSYVNGAWHAGAMQSFTTASNYVTTDAATNVAQYGATVNGTNGSFNAQDTSFWWGTTPAGPFTAGGNVTEFPATGWQHDAGLGSALIGGPFHEGLTELAPSTTYYYVAWSDVGDIWYPGDVMTFTTPALGGDATLSALGVSDGILSPSFTPGTTEYSDVLPYNVTVVPTVTATSTDPNATTVITQATSTTGTATVKVTAQDGVTTQDYTVDFSLAAPTSSMLTVKVLVNNFLGGSATPSDFTVNVIGNATEGSSTTFPGNAGGTMVTLVPNTTYSASIIKSNAIQYANYIQGLSGGCQDSSGLPSGSLATCTFTETYIPFSPTFSVTVGGGPNAYGSNVRGAVLGENVSGNAALEAQIQALQQQLAALLQQYLALLQSELHR